MALKKIGFTLEELRHMDMSEALAYIDATDPEPEGMRMATQAETDAFMA